MTEPTAHPGDVPRYRLPPSPIREILDAPTFPSLLLSPTRDMLALARRPRHPALETLARPELRLAGLRLDPSRRDRSRREPFATLALTPLDAREERSVTGLPRRPRLDDISFAPDGRHLAFTQLTASGLELWVVDVARARAERLVRGPLSGVAGSPYRWLPDGSGMIVLAVPAGAERAPARAGVPEGPVVLVNDGRIAAARTFQDLLKDPHDEALLEHYLTTELVRVGLDGRTQAIGEPAMYTAVATSPDGSHVLLGSIRRPFSYRVPLGRFPFRVEVRRHGAASGVVVADLPLAETVPVTFGSVREGRRWIAWRPDAPAQLAVVEAQDGGDAGQPAEVRDRLYLLDAPFDGEPRELMALATRFGGVTWGDDDLALVTEWWWPTRREKTWRIAPREAPAPVHLLFDRSFEDRYGDPGSPVMRPTRRGGSVMLVDEGRIFLIGEGSSPDGDHPFLDVLDLSNGSTTRLWQSAVPGYQRPVTMLDAATLTVVLRAESPEEPPNYTIVSLADGAPPTAAEGGAAARATRAAPPARALTAYTHPYPPLRAATKTLLRYARTDGVELTATLHLPPGHDPARDGPLPLLMWAYPQGFKSAGHAEQVRAAPHRWEPIWWSSPLLWLTQGYAVLDDPSMPIIGEGETEPNDTYVEQLVMGAEAAVEAVVARGVASRERIAVGGHSYGAFMTAHLLAHTDLFCAGIARSGSYNRTLTPFGFQSEERTLWQAPAVYEAMSAFQVADRITAPLLLIHGKADDNAGTYPEQSERFYDALKGLGKRVRLVLLPHESHGYRARESVMHVLWEMTAWLDAHVKAGPRAAR